MRAFRIADRRFPIFDGGGARLVGGRWNSPGRTLIYSSETYSGAMLEILAHANLGRLPRTHAYIEIAIPEDIAFERIEARHLPQWDSEDQLASRAFGDRWLDEQRTAILMVPSLVTRGIEHNVLLNPLHPDFVRIHASEPHEVMWDARLFRSADEQKP
ncbi:MAG TPA: RES domain-containing protein [Silvibacterium sp.]|nr:RES domain-containing protein [Silvibacterium sp.]